MEPKTGTLAHYLTGFYLSKEAEGLSPNPLREYEKDFTHLARWCSANGKPDPTKLTPVISKLSSRTCAAYPPATAAP